MYTDQTTHCFEKTVSNAIRLIILERCEDTGARMVKDIIEIDKGAGELMKYFMWEDDFETVQDILTKCAFRGVEWSADDIAKIIGRARKVGSVLYRLIEAFEKADCNV